MTQDIGATAVSLASVRQDVAETALAVGLQASSLRSPAAAHPILATPPQAAAPLRINPVAYLDPTVGLVVLQFYNAQGVQTASIPTQRQLQSYRLHAIETGDFAPQPIPDADP